MRTSFKSILISASILLTLAIIFPIIGQGNSAQSPAAEADDVDQLIKNLKDPDSDVRKEAAISLGNLGDVKAVDALISALGDDNWSVRMVAAGALGDLGDARALQPLIQAMNDEHKYVRSHAAGALGELGDVRAVTPLIKALSHEDPLTRSAVAASLGELGDSRAVDPLIQSLSDEWSAVRSSAASALGLMDDARAVEPLIKALADKGIMGYVVRKSAASSLGQLGDARAVEPLIQALNDEESSVRWNAAKALGELGDSSAIDPLIEALDDADKDVVFWASYSLAKLGKTEYVDSLTVFLEDEEYYIRRQAAEALGDLGNPKAVEPLIKALNDKDTYVRLNAAEALGKIGDARAKDPLLSAQEDENSDVREAAAAALKKLNLTYANESKSQIIGFDGGSINLSRGIRVVIPSGSVNREMEVSVRKLDPATYLRNDLYDGIVLEIQATAEKLNRAAEIRVPLPSYIDPDSNSAFGGTVDETGALIVENSTIETIDGRSELVISTDHFSIFEFFWADETLIPLPKQAGPLLVPFYEQGTSKYCWAASTLMICQAAQFKKNAQVYHIIGKMGIRDTGIKWLTFPSDKFNDTIKEQCGLEPIIIKWFAQSKEVREYIKQKLFLQEPVMVLSANDKHAWVIVGYNGDQFYVLDSKDPDSKIQRAPYDLVSWEPPWLPEYLVTVEARSIELVHISDHPITVNIKNDDVEFVGNNNPVQFRWDYLRPRGYCLSSLERTAGNEFRQEYSPDGIGVPLNKTEVAASVSVANADLAADHEVTVCAEIFPKDNPVGNSKAKSCKTCTIPPKTVQEVKFDNIKKSDFYVDGVTDYTFRVIASKNGEEAAEASFDFRLVGLKIEIKSPEGTILTSDDKGLLETEYAFSIMKCSIPADARYKWYFEDDETAEGERAIHKYTSEDRYKVEVKATWAGGSAEDSMWIEIAKEPEYRPIAKNMPHWVLANVTKEAHKWEDNACNPRNVVEFSDEAVEIASSIDYASEGCAEGSLLTGTIYSIINWTNPPHEIAFNQTANVTVTAMQSARDITLTPSIKHDLDSFVAYAPEISTDASFEYARPCFDDNKDKYGQCPMEVNLNDSWNNEIRVWLGQNSSKTFEFEMPMPFYIDEGEDVVFKLQFDGPGGNATIAYTYIFKGNMSDAFGEDWRRLPNIE